MAFSCKARAVCPSCLGRRMCEGAFNLTEHVLPEVPLRQLVLTMPFPLRFPLAFDGKLLGQVARIFADTVAGWRRAREARVGQGLGGQALAPKGTGDGTSSVGCRPVRLAP